MEPDSIIIGNQFTLFYLLKSYHFIGKRKNTKKFICIHTEKKTACALIDLRSTDVHVHYVVLL